MAEGYANASYNWPTMNWAATDLSKEWERFYQHCEFAFGGPLSKCTEKEKICNLMSFVGDKGQEIYLTFQWDTVQVGSGENRHDISERDILERVAEKFKVHLEAKKNPIMVAVKFDRRRQLQGETFDLGYLPGKRQVLADTLSQRQNIQNSNKKLQTSPTSCTL